MQSKLLDKQLTMYNIKVVKIPNINNAVVVRNGNTYYIGIESTWDTPHYNYALLHELEHIKHNTLYEEDAPQIRKFVLERFTNDAMIIESGIAKKMFTGQEITNLPTIVYKSLFSYTNGLILTKLDSILNS